MKAIFDHAEPVARGLKTFWFRPEKPVRYVAGQFTELYLPHAADSRGERRWFTLSSSPTEPLLSITTKFPAAGVRRSSFKGELERLRPGTEVFLAEPMGDFVLPKDDSIPLLFVAAGAGITPVRSMVKYMHDASEYRDAQLLYAASHVKELAFLDLFAQAHVRLVKIVKNRPAEYDGESGSLNTARILRHAGGTADVGSGTASGASPYSGASEPHNGAPALPPYIFISGPESMVEKFYKELRAAGVSEDRLVADYFQGYAPI